MRVVALISLRGGSPPTCGGGATLSRVMTRGGPQFSRSSDAEAQANITRAAGPPPSSPLTPPLLLLR